MSRLPTGRVTDRLNWKDIIGAGGEAFSADPIEDAGADEIYLPSLHAFLITDFRINTQEDGLGTDLTLDVDYEFAEFNTKLTTEYGVEVYEKVKILNVTYQTGSIWAFGKYSGDVNFAEYFNTVQAQIDALMSGTSAVLLGSKHTFFIYEDLSAYGLLAFTHASFSQANYQGLFDKIGHIFNAMHVDAGGADLSASGTLFYATPIPGYYERGGTKDTAVIDSTADVDDTTELITLATADYDALHMTRGVLGTGADGVPVRLKLISGALPTGLAEDTTYFINFGTTPDISLHTTEALAIAGTSAIDLTDAVGTFKITQEGVYFDDAMQGHHHTARTDTGSGAQIAGIPPSNNIVYDTDDTTPVRTPITDGVNGTPRTTNETRPKTFISFGYIKAEHITTAGEPVSALRYVKDWTSTSTWTGGASITINHDWGVAFDEYKGQIFIRQDSAPDKIYNVTNFEYYNAAYLGERLNGIDGDLDNCYLQIQASGGFYVNDSGNGATVPTSGWSYKVILERPNLVATYADTSFRKVYDIADATDETFNLPDAITTLTEQIIKRRGSGSGKVLFTTQSSQTIDDLTASIWELEGEGIIVLFPSGGNWEVKEYSDKGTSSGDNWKKYKDGELRENGTDTTSTGADTPITWPMAFDNIKGALATVNHTSIIGDDSAYFHTITVTTGQLNVVSGGARVARDAFWEAIGRWRT